MRGSQKMPVKKNGHVADEKGMVSFSPEQLNTKKSTIASCLSGETGQKFSFIQRLCVNAKPQFISLRRKEKQRRKHLLA